MNVLSDLSIIDLYSLLVTIIATLFAIFSLVLTYIGYCKFKQADKLVENKINQKLKEFETSYEEDLINIQSANAKINSSYKYFDTQEYDKVLQILKEAEKIYPKAYNLYNTMGYAYEAKNDIQSAELTFQKAILYHPKRIEGYNDLSNLYKRIDNLKKSEEVYQKALKNVPDAESNWQLINR